MHHPAATSSVMDTATALATARVHRTSSHSESSVEEPMEISQHTATSASDANNSSLLVSKSSHNTHHTSEEEDDDQNNNNNNPLKKLYIKTRRGLVNGRRSDEDADAEEEDAKQQYTASWRHGKSDQPGNYLTILRKKGRYSSSNNSNSGHREEKWNGKDEFEAAIQHHNKNNATSSADVTCRICSKVIYLSLLGFIGWLSIHPSIHPFTLCIIISARQTDRQTILWVRKDQSTAERRNANNRKAASEVENV